jgi:hypothetical protein
VGPLQFPRTTLTPAPLPEYRARETFSLPAASGFLSGCSFLSLWACSLKFGYRAPGGQFCDENGDEVSQATVNPKPIGRPAPVVAALDQVDDEPVAWLGMAWRRSAG